MPFLLLIIGLMLGATAIRGTQGTLAGLFAADAAGFAKWFAAIVFIGLIGYIPGFQTVSRLLLGLVILIIVIEKKGVFAQLQNALSNPPAPSKAPEPVTQNLGPFPIQLSVSGGAGGAGGIAGALGGLLGGGSGTGPAAGATDILGGTASGAGFGGGGGAA